MFFVGFAAFGDTIKLKDGSVLKGKVVSYGQGKFTIIVYIGGTPSRYVLSVDEVDSVEFDPSTDLASASGGIAASPGTTTPAVDSSASSRAALRSLSCSGDSFMSIGIILLAGSDVELNLHSDSTLNNSQTNIL